jgi:hypothetical protein
MVQGWMSALACGRSKTRNPQKNSSIFRLKHVHGTNFSAAAAMPYIGGALIAACFCWIGATCYFWRRYTLSAWIALATVLILLVYRIASIGW